MDESELTDEMKPSRESTLAIVPINKRGWVRVGQKMEGPFDVVAVAVRTDVERIHGRVVVHRGNEYTEYRLLPDENSDWRETVNMQFLILPDDTAQWEELWFSRGEIVFSERAARDMEERIANRS